MKKKLLVLSASAILASNFIFDNSASAVVDVSKNDYTSEALSLKGTKSHYYTLDDYKDSLEKLVQRLTVNMHDGYDEKEYKVAHDKYQKRFMAEMEAVNKFVFEEKQIKYHAKRGTQVPNGVYGLTQQRYASIYSALQKNRIDFEKEVKKIEEMHPDLQRFNYVKQDEADRKLNELENKALMLAKTFWRQDEAILNLYNKLDMIVGYTEEERYYKKPTNERMLKESILNLETVIDEFFEEIDLARPQFIPALTKTNGNDKGIKNKLREDARAAKQNPNLIDSGVKERANKANKKKEEMTKDARIGANKIKSDTKIPTTLSSTKRNVQRPQPKLKQIENKVNTPEERQLSKKIAGVNGESNHITSENNLAPSSQYGSNGQLIEFSENTLSNSTGSVKQQPTFTEDTKPTKKEVITESHAVDLDGKTTHYMSGYTSGYSVEDTSGYTERDKRAIRRNHVREAEELVNKYVNSHAYQDRVAAQAKVKTLSPEQQKRLNQQIDKIYNGQ